MELEILDPRAGSERVVVDAIDRDDWQPSVDGSVDPVLRAKYIDYCSAQLTEVFLSLPDERVYQLLEEAALDADLHPGDLGFLMKVRLVTRRLRESVPLPNFDDWSREYREDPARFDVHLLGLWKELVQDESGAERRREGDAGPERA